MDKSLIMLKCKSCGGEYKNILDDGMEYYHACPPIIDIDGNMLVREDKRDENIRVKKEGKGTEVVVIAEEI